MIGEKYPYRTGVRVLMIPVALVVGTVVGLLWEWEAGLLAAILLIWLAPELCTIFLKPLRKHLVDEEKQRQEDKKLTHRWYHYLFREGKDDGNVDGYVPPIDM